MAAPFPIPPGAWLGLLGGGQLGRMFCMAAQSLGYRVAVLDPGADGPAAGVADRHLHADYLDPAGLARLAGLATAATTEFENVPASALEFLARSARVCPQAESVAIAQDRIREKAFFAANGFAVAPFAVLSTAADARGVGPGAGPRHRQERPAGLRRQGPDPGAVRCPRSSAPSPRWAACPACSSASSTSPARCR